MEALKNVGLVLVGVAIFFASFFVAALLINGMAWVSDHVLEYLITFSNILSVVCIVLLVSLAPFRKTRIVPIYGLYVASFVFGVCVWVYGFAVTYQIWGGVGVFIGLMLGIVGIVPLGIIAASWQSEWVIAAELIYGLVLTYGARAIALWLATKIEADADRPEHVQRASAATARTDNTGAMDFRIAGLWQDLNRAFNNFWNSTPEARAAMELPTYGARFKASWKASWRWPVIWRRAVVIFVGMQLVNVGYFTVRGFQTVSLERSELAGAAYALEQATQEARTAKAGSPQELQAREKMRKAMDRLAASANKPLVQFIGEVTQVQINPYSQFAVDKGFGDLCKQLSLSLYEQADAAIQSARFNMHALYCQPRWDELTPVRPPSQRNKDDWAVVSVDELSNADAMRMTGSERAQGIAKYCRGLNPAKLTDAEISFSTSEELRILKRFKCWE